MTPVPGLVDIGANLTNKAFRYDLEEVLERAANAGIGTIMVTGTSEDASRDARELALRYPGRLYATAGVHPHEAKDFGVDTASALRELAATVEVVAIGETGLDFNRNYSPPGDQERAFEEQLALASDLAMPVFLHERDAHARQVEILRSFRDGLVDGVAHCFTGSREELYGYLDLDLYVGITGWICDERRGLHLRELVGEIPRDRLLLETDAPWLLPRTLRPVPEGRRNEPAFLTEVLGAVAECTGRSVEQLAAETAANARRLFRLHDG